MFIEKDSYFIIEEFEKLGIKALYTKKNAGNLSDYCYISEDQAEDRLNVLTKEGLENKIQVFSHQTHTNNVVDIKEDTDKYIYSEVDGFITKRRDVVLFTFHADCLPIFLYDKKEEVIGVVHSGWKGTYNDILKEAIDMMKSNYNSNPENIMVALGIGIGEKSYEVGEDFHKHFAEKYNDKEIMEKAFKMYDTWHFNNYECNKELALREGILAENIIVADEDTFDKKFHSHRRDGRHSGRSAAIISFDNV